MDADHGGGRRTAGDPAFLWETEAIRSARHRRGHDGSATPPADRHRRPESPGQADDAGTWVTLREAEAMTGLGRSTVRNWAKKGRVRSRSGAEPGSPRLVDLADVRRHAAEQGRTVGTAPAVASPVPEGSMIVPIDAWERILLQLGNLHEAGRELAEARERAARAETEARFLRERLAELREPPTPPDAGAAVAPPPAGRAGADLRSRARNLRDRWERRRRR